MLENSTKDQQIVMVSRLAERVVWASPPVSTLDAQQVQPR
jgi:hypothetical protein